MNKRHFIIQIVFFISFGGENEKFFKGCLIFNLIIKQGTRSQKVKFKEINSGDLKYFVHEILSIPNAFMKSKLSFFTRSKVFVT